MAGQVFSAVKFCHGLRERYGIAMNPLVAEGWAPRFEYAGLLEGSGDQYARTFRCVADGKQDEDRAVADRVERLLDELIDHAAERMARSKVAIQRGEIEAGIIERLQRSEFLDLLLKPENARRIGKTLTLPKPDEEEGVRPGAVLDYVLASRILELSETNRAQFELISDVAAGALVSEVVASLREPPRVGAKSVGGIVYLDSPLIIDLLNLADVDQFSYASDLVKDLREVGFSLRTYRHNVSEIAGILRGALSNYSNATVAAGSVAYRIRIDASARARAQAAKVNLDARVRQLGITIIDLDTSPQPQPLRFGPDAITDLITRIRPYGDVYSREVDARSVAGVSRQVLGRNYVASTMSLPAIFLTKNSGLARIAHQALIDEHNYNSDAASPFVTDRQIAGLVWMALGGSAGTITAKRLIANCSLVTTPRKDVISSVYKFLEQTSEEDARQFESLMAEERCATYVMDYTLGDAALVTQENAADILSEVKRRAVEDVREQDRELYRAEAETQENKHQLELEQRTAELTGRIAEMESAYSSGLEELSTRIEGQSSDLAQRERDMAAEKEQSRKITVALSESVTASHAWSGPSCPLASIIRLSSRE